MWPQCKHLIFNFGDLTQDKSLGHGLNGLTIESALVEGRGFGWICRESGYVLHYVLQRVRAPLLQSHIGRSKFAWVDSSATPPKCLEVLKSACMVWCNVLCDLDEEYLDQTLRKIFHTHQIQHHEGNLCIFMSCPKFLIAPVQMCQRLVEEVPFRLRARLRISPLRGNMSGGSRSSSLGVSSLRTWISR